MTGDVPRKDRRPVYSWDMPTSIAVESPLQDDVRTLIAALNDYLLSLTPAEFCSHLTVEQMAAPDTTVFIAREDGRAVACGALRRHEGLVGEVKRMYTVPSHQGQGIGGRILAEIESLACEEGITRLVLETGHLHDAAWRVYERGGFTRCGPVLDYPLSDYSVFYEKYIVPEAQLVPTDEGLAAGSEGWFVLNARDARWSVGEGRGAYCEFEREPGSFPQLGVGIVSLAPGEPMAMYHWEADQEDFLVLEGSALLIAEGEERPLRRWDFVHCPAGTRHVIVGAGEAPCLVLAVGARERSRGEHWGAYAVDDAAVRHGAGVEEATTDSRTAYGRFPERFLSRYRAGWLPGDGLQSEADA